MRTYTHRSLLLLILLLATGLRFAHLDTQSFWNDEGNTARLVERTVPLIIEGAAGDIHPPGYYLLLHLWRALTGESEFALRSFSAFCGVLTVVFTAAVGYHVGGRTSALSAALLVTLNPLAVYYSQEARMYALLSLASAMTLWAAINLVRIPCPVVRVSYEDSHFTLSRLTPHVLRLSLSIALGLYTQYTYGFVLVGLNLAFGAWWFAQGVFKREWRWRLAFRWGGAHLLGGLAFFPWAPIALGASDWRPPDLMTEQAIIQMGRAMLMGVTLPADVGKYVLSLGSVLAGLALLRKPRLRFAVWAAIGMALMPPVIIVILGAYRPAYLKFLVSTIAPLAVWLSLPFASYGQRSKPQLLRVVMALILLAMLWRVQVTSLRHLYTDPAYARDDYRALATLVASEGQPGDAILLNAPNQWEVFTYYYKGPLPVYPAPYRPTPQEADAWVADIVEEHSQLFVLYWGNTESDPEHLIAKALAERAYRAQDQWISTVLLARYGTAPHIADGAMTRVNVQLGDAIALEGYRLPHVTYMPGDIIPLTLAWRAETARGEPLKVFVHVLDVAGQLVAQYDGEPRDGLFPTSLWEAGTRLDDNYGVWLPTDLPPGAYALNIGLYRYSGERLPIIHDGQPAGDTMPLATITIKEVVP